MFSRAFGPGVGVAARLAAVIILIAALAGVASAQTLTATPASLTAAAQQGSTTIQTLPVALTSSTGTQVGYQAYFDAGYPSWLSLAGGVSNGFTGRDNLNVTVNPTGLAAGSYTSSHLHVYMPSYGVGNTITISVSFNIGTTAAISVNTNTLTFTATAGGSSPVSQNVQVSTASTSNIVATTAIAYTSASTGWLSVIPTSGTLVSGTPLPLTVSAATGSLPAGNHTATLTVSSGANTQVVNVTFNVQAGSTISASPNPVYLNAQTGGASVTQNVTVTNLTASSVTVTPSISAGSGWLSTTGSVTIGASSTATVTITASPSAGSQTGQLTLTPSTGSAINVPVYLTVSASGTFSLNKSAMVFNTTTNQLGDQVVLTNSSASQISYSTSIAYGQVYNNWLSINPSNTTISASSQLTVGVSANAAGLPTATYTATITFTPTGSGSAQTITVTFSVGGSVSISANPTSLTINAPLNQSASASVQISSTNSGVSIAPTSGATLYCTSPTYQYCGTITPASAVASPGFPATFTVSSWSGLTTGTYTVTLTFSSGVGSVNVPLTINAGTGFGGGLTATPSALSFSGTSGSVVQSSQLYLSTGTAAYYSASSNQGWLSVGTQGSSFASVYAPGYLSVFANPAALSAGTYYGSINITGTGGTLTVSVTFTVSGGGGGALTVTPATLSFSAPVGTGQTAAQSVTVYGNTVVTYYVQPTTQSGGSWLVPSQTSGQTGTSFTVVANPSGLGAGTYYGSLSVTSSIGSQTVTVTFVVGGGGGGGTCSGTAGSITASPTALQFTGNPGGGPTAAQTVTLSTVSASADYLVSFTSNWIAAQPQVGTVTSIASRTLQVQTSPANLTTGTYNDVITITGGGGQVCVQVTFIVGGGGGGGGTSGLTASPSTVTMSSPLGSTSVVQQSVLLSGTSGLTFTAYATTTSGYGWLSVTPSTGTSPATLLVQANPTSLGTGSQQGNIVVSTYLGTMNIPVIFNVGTSGGYGNLTVTPAAMNFSAQSGGAAPAAQTLYVSSTTGFSTSFNATVSNASWLSVSPTSSFTPAALNVTVNQAGMAAGTFYGTINIVSSDGFSQQTVQVTLTVSSANLVVAPASLTFTAPAGGSAPAQSLSVSSPLGSVSFTASASTTSGGSWLTVSPTSSSTTSSVNATVNAAGLNPGAYNGTLTFSSGVGTVNVPVTLTVTQVVTMTVAPETLAFEAVAGATTAIPTKTINVNVSSGNVQYTAAAATSAGGSWLQVTPTSGTTPGTLTVTASATGLNPGVFNGTVTVSIAGASNSPRVVQVTLTVTSPAPVVSGVVNAAAGNAGILAAGTITSIYGQGLGPDTAVFPQIVTGGLVPTEVGTVRVLFDGIAAPILYAQARQVNTVIPWSLFGRTTVRVEVEYKGNRSAATQIQLYDAAPGIFSVDGSGKGQGAILNQDFSVNSTLNGAAVDSAVAIYATGMGQTDPLGVDGSIPTSVLPKPVLPVSVLIGNTEGAVEYAAAAPYLISGAMQVNVRIPRGLQPGAYALTLRIGRFSSQLGITIVVK